MKIICKITKTFIFYHTKNGNVNFSNCGKHSGVLCPECVQLVSSICSFPAKYKVRNPRRSFTYCEELKKS